MRPWLASLLVGAAAVTAGEHPALAAPPVPAPQEGAAALVEKGQALLDRGDYPGARDAFLKAVEKDPASVPARRGAAKALLGLGRADEAIQHAYKGLDLTQDKDAELWVTAARAFLHKGDTLPAGDENIPMNYADAAAKASQALQIDPDRIEAYAVLGKAMRLQGRTPDALQALKEGLAKAPADFDLLFEQGMTFIRATDYAAAVESFDRAAAADPGSAQARFRKGFALCYLAKWEEAYAEFVKAAVLDPSDRSPLQYLAKYAKDDSTIHYRKILRDAPGHAWAHAYLAYYLAYQKQADEALKESKAALALASTDAGIVAWHGQVLEVLGKKQEAISHYVKALGMDPGTDLAWNNLLAFATAPGSGAKIDERREAIAALAKARPADALLWNNVGLLHRDVTKDFRASLEAYLKAAENAPNDQGIQNDTGLIYLYHGKDIKEDRRKGLPYFERTLQLVDDEGQSPEMGYRDSLENLAVYYMEVEPNPSKALEYAERRNDPDFLSRLPRAIAGSSPRAAGVAAWARKELRK